MTDHAEIAAERIIGWEEPGRRVRATEIIREAMNAEAAETDKTTELQAKIEDLRGVIEALENHAQNLERCLMRRPL